MISANLEVIWEMSVTVAAHFGYDRMDLKAIWEMSAESANILSADKAWGSSWPKGTRKDGLPL